MHASSDCRVLWLLAGLVWAPLAARADAPKDTGAPAAKCTADAGVLLVKEAKDKWKVAKAGEMVPSGAMLVGLPRVELISPSGKAKLLLLADVGRRGVFPVLEAGVILHDAAGADLDVTFARGLIVVENLQGAGEAKVRLRIDKETWLLTLQQPGTKVGLEIFARQPPGVLKAGKDKSDAPTTDVLLLVISGQAFLETGHEGLGLRAPPGQARMHWDSVAREHSFQRLEKLPDALVQFIADQGTSTFKELCAGTARLKDGNLASGLDELVGSPTPVERMAGLTLAGAVDDLPRVFGALLHSKDAATRDHAILVLRNWLGREPGQIEKLQAALVDSKKLTVVQARSLIQLLLGFDQDERGRPETYAVLLSYLGHQNQAVRALAYWHLERLAPAGKAFAFDASAPEEQRREAVRRWHMLIPDGQLPSRAKG